MPIVVMKIGGSCLSDKTAFKKILTIINIYKDAKKILVVSALKGITDLLLKTAQGLEDVRLTDKSISIIEKKHMDVIEQIFEEDSKHYIKAKDWIDEKLSELDDTFADIQEFGLEPYYRDYVLSFGEILSTYILNQYLLSCSIDSVFIPANNLIITNDEFNNAYPLYELTKSRIEKLLIPLIENPKKDIITCLTGFIGRNKIGYITTLGQGGSDYTATIIARSLYSIGIDKNIKVILWKDVDGLLAINPKYAPKSSLIKNLNYEEAKHIANFGAKILHPKCLEAIEKFKIPLEIRNFDNPLDVNFTEISDRTDNKQIKGISVIENATIITVASASLVDVPGVLAKIFKSMSKNKISVSLVAQSSSEISTSFIINTEDREAAIKALNKSKFLSDFFEIKWEDVAVINITGLKILDTKTKAELFMALDRKNVKVKAISQSFDELNLSLVVEREKLIDAINAIHNDLCEDFKS
ncbi:MAG: aspartate kinase [Candidatus Lokiarchaeota archaeon]|nr:aspartate kinase [Candidatus Lokiarchaeota archaeon]